MSLNTALAEYRDPKMPDYIKHSVLRDVAYGLSFLHGKELPILHRDLAEHGLAGVFLSVVPLYSL